MHMCTFQRPFLDGGGVRKNIRSHVYISLHFNGRGPSGGLLVSPPRYGAARGKRPKGGHLWGMCVATWQTRRGKRLFGIVYPPQRGVEEWEPELNGWAARWLHYYSC